MPQARQYLPSSRTYSQGAPAHLTRPRDTRTGASRAKRSPPLPLRQTARRRRAGQCPGQQAGPASYQPPSRSLDCLPTAAQTCRQRGQQRMSRSRPVLHQATPKTSAYAPLLVCSSVRAGRQRCDQLSGWSCCSVVSVARGPPHLAWGAVRESSVGPVQARRGSRASVRVVVLRSALWLLGHTLRETRVSY